MEKKLNIKLISCVALILLLMGASSSYATLYTGSLSSALDGGLVSGGETWDSTATGFQVTWEISHTEGSATWHYKYTFQNEDGGTLSMLVSHMIISLSDNIADDDLFNFGVDVEDWEINTYGPHKSNPEFPAGETIYGIKLNLWEDQLVAEFDSNRMPMWGDFYARDGGDPKNYAYNTDLGTAVFNPHDVTETPVDAAGNALDKILVPNTVPEPATLLILALGGLTLFRPVKRHS